MPKGDEEEIAGRGEGIFRFVALLAPRALLELPTLNLSLIRDQLGLMANVPSIGSPRCCELCLGRCAYANLVACARLLVKLDDGSRWQVFPGDLDVILNWMLIGVGSGRQSAN
jgi:hypothetical protein